MVYQKQCGVRQWGTQFMGGDMVSLYGWAYIGGTLGIASPCLSMHLSCLAGAKQPRPPPGFHQWNLSFYSAIGNRADSSSEKLYRSPKRQPPWCIPGYPPGGIHSVAAGSRSVLQCKPGQASQCHSVTQCNGPTTT
jgi:hypothetical protein